jgi:hypothetical protein
MSVHDILEPNQFDLFCKSTTIEGVKIANTTDNVSYTQQLQNKNGIIALISDIVESNSFYASLTINNPNVSTPAITSLTTFQQLPIMPIASAVVNYSNFSSIVSSTHILGLKYFGTATKKFRITFSISIDGSNSEPIILNLYKNSVATTYFCTATPASSSRATFILDFIMDLALDDEITIYERSDTITQDITLFCPSFQVMAV